MECVRQALESGGDLFTVRTRMREIARRMGLDLLQSLRIEYSVRLSVFPKIRQLSQALARKVEKEAGLSVSTAKATRKLEDAAEDTLKALQTVEVVRRCGSMPFV